MLKSTLCVVFTTTHANTLGNACRLDMVNFMLSYFNVIIITNQAEFIKKLFPNQEVVSVKGKKNLKFSLYEDIRYWKYLGEKINLIHSDGVFMFHDDAPSTIWVNKAVFQYIHQYGKRSAKNSRSFKDSLKFFKEQFNHMLLIRGLKKSQMSFVVSTFLIDFFKNEGIKELKYIPHAIDINKFKSPMITDIHKKQKELFNDGYLIITYTGWVTENRGFSLMMDIIYKISRHNKKVVLVIAGADKDFSLRILEYQKKNQLHNNIINYGVVDAELIPGILFFSSLCLSFWDVDVPGFQMAPPQKIIEYFAAGKPVVCNKIQTHSVYVENGRTGLVLNMDSTEISNSILELFQNKDYYNQMCANAANEAKKYDISNVYYDMVQTIRERIDES
ncbi:MAG: glycosyltransferase [Tenuifilaceae bacterium]|jgi:glycosyltransferase involved in cell wall biosynthesis|nr:glycosyltransferase [Tenuifilaceae bacterium]